MPLKGSKYVTYNWTQDAERLMLFAALERAEFQPNRALFTEVTQNLGAGVSVEAVRYNITCKG